MSNVVFAITIGSRRVTAAAIAFAGRTRSKIFIEQENCDEAVRHGCIVNIKQMASILDKLIIKLNNRAKAIDKSINLRETYIAIGGITMHSLKHESKQPELPDMETVDSEQLEDGEYLHTIMDFKAFNSVESALNLAKVKALDIVTVPKATSTILSAQEKNDGCLLVDLGFGTTTVQVFESGHLKHLAVIPVGGDAVTRDIMQFAKVTREQAERLKVDWSDANANIDEIDDCKNKSFEDANLQIPRHELNTIVVCRYEEILKNVREQLNSSMVSSLSMCILTGGGSKQRGIESLTRKILEMPALPIQKRAFTEPCDPTSSQRFELSDIFGLSSLCPVPENKHEESTTVEEKKEHEVVLPAAPEETPKKDVAEPKPEAPKEVKEEKQTDTKETKKSFGSWVKDFFGSNN